MISTAPLDTEYTPLDQKGTGVMRTAYIFLLAFIWQLFCNNCFAAGLTPTLKSSDEVAVARLKLETEQAGFNRQLELQKLEMEKTKAWITGGSMMVPLMVAAFTLALGVWNQNQQARLQRETQERAERAQFELKAAELVLNEKGPVGAKNKAKALQALFPDKLPKDFVSSFNPADFEGKKPES